MPVSAALLGALLAPPQATAADPLGFYVGAGVGQTHVVVDSVGNGHNAGYRFDRSDSGWKAIVGLRPLKLIGAELEYLDFGHPGATLADGAAIDATIRGSALFGLLYLPLPLPALGLYAKVGVAHLLTTVAARPVSGQLPVDVCFFDPTQPGCPAFGYRRSGSGAAWGAGAELKLRALSVRAEYERFDSGQGTPTLASLLLSWRF